MTSDTRESPPGTGHGEIRRAKSLAEALHALRLLRSKRWLVEDLAAELGVGRRTAERLLAALGEAGVEITRDVEGRNVYHHITKAALQRAVGL